MSQDLVLNLNITIYAAVSSYTLCLMHSLMMVHENLEHVAGSYLINICCVGPIL